MLSSGDHDLGGDDEVAAHHLCEDPVEPLQGPVQVKLWGRTLWKKWQCSVAIGNIAIGDKRSQKVTYPAGSRGDRLPTVLGTPPLVVHQHEVEDQVIAITIWTKKKVTMTMMIMLIWPWQKTCGWCTSAWDCRPPQIPAIFGFYKFWSDLEKTSTKVNKTNTTGICKDLVETNTKGRNTWQPGWLTEREERRTPGCWKFSGYNLQEGARQIRSNHNNGDYLGMMITIMISLLLMRLTRRNLTHSGRMPAVALVAVRRLENIID